MNWRGLCRRLPFLIVFALFLPLLSSSDSKPVPSIFSGDEAHYLLAIHSLMLDGDLDLANNYDAVHKGAKQAGRNFAGAALDHQSVWFENGKRQSWDQIYETQPVNFDRDAAGNPVARLLPGHKQPDPGHPEYSTHPPGLALLLAPVIYPIRNTEFVEPAAVFCSTLAIVAAFFLFRALLMTYVGETWIANVVALVAFLGTPAWHYGRTLFSEPYLLLFAVGSYCAALRYRNPFLAGVFIGLGILMKPPFALLLLPLLGCYAIERNYRSLMLVTIPATLGVAAILSSNFGMFGSPFAASQEWQQGSFVRGSGGILLSLRYGALMIMPAFLVALIAWPAFLRRFPKDATVIASGFMLYFMLGASWKFWNGATAYSARLLVPVIPLFFVSLVSLPQMEIWKRRPARIVAWAICGLSIIINGFGALPYWKNWDTNPPLRLAQFMSGN